MKPATLVGAVLGAAAAVGVASESARSSNLYWTLGDKLVVPLLRRLADAETAHNLSVSLLRARLGPVEPVETKSIPTLRTRVFDRDFSSPVGLAAGYDKQAYVCDPLLDMGFAFVEVGGVTPQPQPGNAKPRMFRLVEDQAVINRYGLNSEGAQVVAQRLAKRDRAKGLVGVNLAKNSSSADLCDDFLQGMAELGPLSDFVVVNVSCPNVEYTKSLEEDNLNVLLSKVKEVRDDKCPHVPMLVKVGPDMDERGRKLMAKILVQNGIDGIVVSNTSSKRPDRLVSAAKVEQGGLSGAPIKDAALLTTRDLFRMTQGSIPIIGVGGISSAQDAYERIRAGASLIQIYTALTYQGPGLVVSIKKDLDQLLKRDGFDNITQVVGIDAR